MVLANRYHVRVFERGRGSTASAWSQASLQQVLFKVVVLLVVRGSGNPLEASSQGRFGIQNLEPTAGFEPATRCLQNSRSAS